VLTKVCVSRVNFRDNVYFETRMPIESVGRLIAIVMNSLGAEDARHILVVSSSV